MPSHVESEFVSDLKHWNTGVYRLSPLLQPFPSGPVVHQLSSTPALAGSWNICLRTLSQLWESDMAEKGFWMALTGVTKDFPELRGHDISTSRYVMGLDDKWSLPNPLRVIYKCNTLTRGLRGALGGRSWIRSETLSRDLVDRSQIMSIGRRCIHPSVRESDACSASLCRRSSALFRWNTTACTEICSLKMFHKSNRLSS